MHHRSPVLLTGILVATIAVGACSDSNGPENSLDARIRYVNAVKFTTGPVEIGLRNGPSAVVPFSDATSYQSLRPGDYVVFVEDDAGTLDVNGSAFLSAGTDHTLAITGQSDLPRAMFLSDDPGQPDVGQAFVRVANGGLQIGPVDVYLLLPGDQVDGTPTVGGLDWLNVTLYGEFESGEITLVLTDVGTEDIVFDSGPISVPSASVRTLFLYDGAAALDEIALLVLNDEGS
ncbi:MAG: DUF4397 domain-containing protein [Gemmatimonadota bacterium]|jgi:hypothetical protein